MMKNTLYAGLISLIVLVGLAAAATFSPLDPAPFPIKAAATSIAPGGHTTLSYMAYVADRCSVVQSGTCPPLSDEDLSCVGLGQNLQCAKTDGKISAPLGTAACTATFTASCSPGLAVSSTQVSVTNVPPVTDCTALRPLVTPTGALWRKVATTSVLFGDGTVKTGQNAGDYLAVWSYPGTSPEWPGNSGITTRPSGATPGMYFAEKFVVPLTATGKVNWGWSGSGVNSNMSITVSVCAGDFGQQGTNLTVGCKVNMQNSSSGLTGFISATQQAANCTLKPGNTYYLNVLPMARLPLPDTNTSNSTCTVAPCSPWLGMTR